MKTWSTKDFDSMSWHDAHVYGFALLSDQWAFALDIDYVAEWICPSEKGGPVMFRVAPCTLIFENASQVSVQIELGNSSSIDVDRLERTAPRELPTGTTDWLWRLQLHGVGQFSLRATGFRQIARCDPILVSEQSLSVSQRGGVVFLESGGSEPS